MMKDLSSNDKQIEIFCAFIIDYNKIKSTVSKMITSDKESEVKRVHKIYDIISFFVEDTTSTSDILNRLNVETNNPRINMLLDYVKKKINSKETDMHKLIHSHYKSLQALVSPKVDDTIKIEELDDLQIIKADPKVPISSQDLNFLNKIGKLSLNNTAEIREANKDFKSVNFKNKLDELYTSKAYYFEQVFANTDLSIQRKILDIIKERQRMRKPTEEELEATNSLNDINTLTGIDTLSLKTSSNVSDHQAFEAFSKILKRNNNPNLIKKVLKENIIMTALFKTNSKTISPYYGLMKLFVSAQYPYNEIIIKRYMQLLEKDEFQLSEILNSLSTDPEFKVAYEIYQKGQETKLFLNFAEEVIAEITLNDVSDALIDKVVQVIKGFSNRASYSHAIFPQDYMFRMLNDIYYYLVTNDLYNNLSLTTELNDYLYTRISAEFQAQTNPFYLANNTIVFGITAIDLWYDIHKLIHDYNVTWINKYYLKYNEIDVLYFEPHSIYQTIDSDFDVSDLKYLPKDECLVITSESGSKNFDMYLYDIFTRISKGIFGSRINLTLARTEGSGFRKKVFPGIAKTDEIKIRKVITDYITFEALFNKDQRYFLSVYKRKITSALKNILSVEASFDEIIQFVSCEELSGILNIFKSREQLEKLLKKAMRYENSDEESLILTHSEQYFQLTETKE